MTDAARDLVKEVDTGKALMQPLDDLDAFQQLPAEELVLPVRKLVQAVSRDADSERAGEFYDVVTKQYKPELLVAILALSQSRNLFSESFEEAPLCTSNDALTPEHQAHVGEWTTGPTCRSCHFSEWGSGKGNAQACKLSYNLLCYDLDDYQPFVLRVSGTSIRPLREFLTQGRMGTRPAYALATSIRSEKRKFEAGQAHVLKFEAGPDLDSYQAQEMRERSASLRGVQVQTPIREDVDEEVPFE